ncbi:MAG: hypothetical protein V3U04_08505 [Candidatus Aerophobetes bacterium]
MKKTVGDLDIRGKQIIVPIALCDKGTNIVRLTGFQVKNFLQIAWLQTGTLFAANLSIRAVRLWDFGASELSPRRSFV